jgi:TolA-binding protein
VDLLSSALVLVACISIGASAIFITRHSFGTNKHTKAHVKDMQNDLHYVRETKNQEIKELRAEQLRLKGTINKMKQGTTITESDLDMKGGLAENLMVKMIPRKYHEMVRPLLPKAEAYFQEHQEEIIEKIKNVNSKQAQSKTNQAQDITTL